MLEAGRALVDWLEREGRELPWRLPFPRPPYPVLVSEVMLQQTQAERVSEPYRRFLARFPTLESLAEAAVDQVIYFFSGLGYYGRARRLHAAAQAVMAAGGWPRTPPELRRLPGVGAYTGAALAAFCFGSCEPPVDGNLERIAARLAAEPLPQGGAALRRLARETAMRLHDGAPTPAVWEALMELGARICAPASTRCGHCPLAPRCRARETGAPTSFPLPRRRRPAEHRRWVVLWVEREDGRVLLRREDDDAPLLAGLWLPPRRALDGEDGAGAAAALAAECGLSARVAAPVGVVEHAVTHRRITVEIRRLTAPTAVAERGRGWRWVDPLNPDVATSTLTGKIARACGRHPDASVGGRRKADR